MYIKNKISTKNIDAFLKPHATNNRVLVIHSEDIDWKKYFPKKSRLRNFMRKRKPAEKQIVFGGARTGKLRTPNSGFP